MYGVRVARVPGITGEPVAIRLAVLARRLKSGRGVLDGTL
jgi:hypothetical protein